MSIEIFYGNDAEYRQWSADKRNKDGYIVNDVEDEPQATLHKAICKVGRRSVRQRTDRFKACSNNKKQLVAWVKHMERDLVPCGMCKP
jgi:hypothetical protein